MGKYCKEDNLKKQLNLTFSLLKVTIRESEKGFCYISIPTISYSGHVQNIGWMNSVKGGQTAGTTGRALRLEAILLCKICK